MDKQREEFEAWTRKFRNWTPELTKDAWETWQAAQAAQPAHAHAIDTSPERVEKQAGDVQVPNYREIADCVLAGLEDRKGVLNLDVDADIEEEIRQEVADNIRMMLYAAPSTKEQTE